MNLELICFYFSFPLLPVTHLVHSVNTGVVASVYFSRSVNMLTRRQLFLAFVVSLCVDECERYSCYPTETFLQRIKQQRVLFSMSVCCSFTSA